MKLRVKKVRLLDGSVYPVDRCGVIDGQLFIRTIEGSLLDMVSVLGDPEKNEIIEYYIDGDDADHEFFEGYTALTAASQDINGVSLYFRKDEQE